MMMMTTTTTTTTTTSPTMNMNRILSLSDSYLTVAEKEDNNAGRFTRHYCNKNSIRPKLFLNPKEFALLYCCNTPFINTHKKAGHLERASVRFRDPTEGATTSDDETSETIISDPKKFLPLSNNLTTFSKWSRRVHKEESKLLRKFFENFKRIPLTVDKQNQLNINGDFKVEQKSKEVESPKCANQVKDTLFVEAKQRAATERRRLVLRTMSETADFPRYFNPKEIIIHKSEANDGVTKQSKFISRANEDTSQVGATMDKTVQMNGDDDTSSSYSTAEEDHVESEPEPVSMSAYATPRASVRGSKTSLRRSRSSVDALSGPEIESDNENSEAFMSLSDNVAQLDSVVEQKNVQSAEASPIRRKSKVEPMLAEDQPITVKELQAVFNCFKEPDITEKECETLLDSLSLAQGREDFQWSLHQLGGFNTLLFLYARVVEICSDDDLQSKALCLTLTQLRNHYRLTDGPSFKQYNLIRFVLNSEKSAFGFKTFIHIMNFCLSASGTKIVDYQLLESCLLSSWKILTRVRCKDSDAPTGPKSLLECLLIIIQDLLDEKNNNRDLNAALLKASSFSETLLAICYNVVIEKQHDLTLEDGLRLASLVKSILSELMAPPDAYVAVTLVKFGLCPFLPRELPPLPRKEDAFFTFRRDENFSSSLRQTLKKVKEAEEAAEGDRMASAADEPEGAKAEDEVKKDVPEIVGIQNTPDVVNDTRISNLPGDDDGFAEGFQESLLEGVMSILLQAMAILPDMAFDSVLNPQMNAHLFVAYTSHSSVTLKILALKLLSAYLTRAKNQTVEEFLKSKGFFLTSLYIQGTPEMSQLVLNVCYGFGPVSYPLALALLYSNVVANKVMEWVQEDEAGAIPALMSMGLLPSIFNIHENSSAQLAIPLQKLLTTVVRFCALYPKDDPWRVLFTPAVESAYGWSNLVPRILTEATDALRKYDGKELKKSDANNRLMWLIERSSAARLGNHFDKWLLGLFTLHIMEMDTDDETDYWINFVKKNRKKLNHLCGIFLCRLFAPNLDNLDFKMYCVRVLLSFCPNLPNWLPKVLKSDEKIERCFTAFIRIFFNYADKRCVKLDSHLRSPSFQSLISTTNGNLTLTLQMTNPLSNVKSSVTAEQSEDDAADTISEPGNVELSDSALRTRFENILIDAGILSPTSNFSTFTPDFRNFKILLENPTSGVSPSELRQCLALVEKLRAPYSLSANKILLPTAGKPVSNAAYFEEIFDAVNKCAMNMLITVARARTQMEVEVARKVCLQDEDTTAVKQWVNVVDQLVHPKAAWHFPDYYPSFCALDQSEGPGRVRMRLKREYLRVHNRFVMPKFRKTGPPRPPLEYLFMSHSADALKNPVILNEIRFMRFCTRIIPGEELPGEVILTNDHLTFIAENAHVQSENVECRKTAIKYLMKRRYTLEDRAVEIFLECRSFLFVFKTTKDREEFVNVLGLKNIGNSQIMSVNSNLMEASMTSMTSQWLKGHLSNFDYLMYLNTQAGRTYCDLMQYPVFPFVLSKYDSPTLDLLAPQSYRDLKKPMAIQDPSKEEHFVSTYNYLKRECESAPFHYGSHYSNSGIVLHFLVRLPPYTQHFLKYQDGSFDIPDRSFHSMETTWRLASKESNTDFKEAIPEFYYLPEFLMNLQHFDLGVRQNGQRVDDVVLPPWAKGDARLFTLINRQALESNHVRKFLCDWVDLIFGYKQTGKAAIDAINMFHPSTYEGFEVEGSDDELLIRARKAMVSTYGQTPKQLFAFPHPRATILPEEKCEMEVLDTVWGIRWGNFVGSPACHDLEVIHTREYSECMNLFETNSRVVFWPENTLILGDSVVGDWDNTKIRIKTKVVFNSIGDDITVCRGTTNSIWVGHHSGRISVLKLSPAMDKIVERVDLVGHYKPIKRIDVNLEFSMAISCAGENYAILWDINKYPKIAFSNAIECTEAVDDVYSSRSTGDVLVVNKEYNRVTLFTINGFKIGVAEPDELVESACLSAMDPGRNVNVIAIGCDYGIIRFYSTWDLKFLNQLKVLPLSTLSIKSLRYSKDGRRLYCMSVTEEGSVSVALQLSPDAKNY